ncbi:HlyD family secretion protein [Mesorhizobium sp. M2D.F.Ca.ET.185.01.1.1]|nr:HlyD family secretion protein [Mesorhizobium sp. M2D.F.Ca.ET.140.01.1.1]TGP32942.1 HlyD family secretion protein [Mesorhizobium sp. M2D.F.Ca.ET.232.01.1.1]TGP58392.1 HlyD family secretion protein [Mesorhizobium sp. M2D.F.Ca.ET.226.01.1.1]TGP67474.1 HlyD family secretion protein [Mesorhizobium sp. M2D.F.Ca.ET.225.01.1.1]TGP79291.1 HlyD family secretion protein [bacterium M00.F.Ca.ET.227.01.1.1]TGP81250.1 HlyD family secretion protein [Mesorhizobium sp. M2D.F.Ca.ET.224.01.1.1]TGQ00971.1 HlyD
MDAKTERKEREPAPTEETRAQPRSDRQQRPPGDQNRVENEHADDKRAQDSQANDSRSYANRPGLIRRHPYIAAIAAILILLVIAAVIIWWINARQYEWTDDAFIDARTVTIGAEISGRITDVAVTDNQPVEAGAVLLRIDDSDYQASLKQAEAGVVAARADIANVQAQTVAQKAKIDAAGKQVAQAQAALEFAKSEDQRNRELLAKGTATQQQAQQAASTLRQDQAALDTANANAEAAKSQLAVLQAQGKSAEGKLQQAEAAEGQAKTTLTRTTITAPVAGHATNVTAAKGTYAQPGQVLMMFVPKDVWVKANFKETQLDLVRPSQPVDIAIDAYPEKTFQGHVDSVQAGSGTAFSLLPAENATGNFVKVVQRVPVKIVFDQPPGVYVGPGMSVVPTVKVR